MRFGDIDNTSNTQRKPMTNTPDTDTDWDELFERYLPTYAIDKKYLDGLKAAIVKKQNEARLDELERFTHSEGSIHILAEKVSYQPANHDPIHSWPIIDGKVIIISQDYVKDRIKALQASKEGK